MFTLLPPQQKKSLYKQYRLRLASVLLIFLFTFFVVCICLLFPSKIFLSFEKIGLQSTQDTLKTRIEAESKKGLVETLNSIQATVNAINPENTSILKTIKTIIGVKPNDISVSSFIYTKGKNADSSLTIQGKSATRSSLIEFSKKLKSDPSFTGVELPISNLAKQLDVPFTLTLLGKF